MPRTASGSEVLEQAQQAPREAKTVEELRQAQAVVLPLLLGVSIEPYSPELNPVGHPWDELREKHFHNRFFDTLEDVEEHLANALAGRERDAQRVHSTTAWPWIVGSLPD
ncbi:hypothetical protein [Azohydromonas aeria]|uniref:hypothetical protein n=1 Tax=Azohydromonas aeria TaxID=2590212 RepID=UPI0018DF546C|nr:hypothetical protein [Azohydromonas aeria]